jgi:hypothetical protein
MTVSAGSMIILLLVRLEKLNLSTQTQQLEALAYEQLSFPLLILTPDFQFTYGNKKAKEVCWWAENLAILKSSLLTEESQEALDRLLDALTHHQESTEILSLERRKRKRKRGEFIHFR